ncbi:MAG: Rho termination factor N-terminal domain-containing protein [Erysipelotrichaceae bacterium]
MRLEHYLIRFSKPDLLEIAKDLRIKGMSGLRKAQIAERITINLTSELVFANRIASLGKDEFAYLESSIKVMKVEHAPHNQTTIQLERCYFGVMTMKNEFYVFKEYEHLAFKFKELHLRKEQQKRAWIQQCLTYVKAMHGVIPMELFYRMVRYEVKDSFEKMLTTFVVMPFDMKLMQLSDQVKLPKYSKDHPMYGYQYYLIDLEYLNQDAVVSLLRAQSDKPFYIPTKKEIDEYCLLRYQASNTNYKKINHFLQKQLGFSKFNAHYFCAMCWLNAGESDFINKTFAFFEQHPVDFTEQQAQELVRLCMEASNETRMIVNRGHTPKELRELFQAKQTNGMLFH